MMCVPMDVDAQSASQWFEEVDHCQKGEFVPAARRRAAGRTVPGSTMPPLCRSACCSAVCAATQVAPSLQA